TRRHLEHGARVRRRIRAQGPRRQHGSVVKRRAVGGKSLEKPGGSGRWLGARARPTRRWLPNKRHPGPAFRATRNAEPWPDERADAARRLWWRRPPRHRKVSAQTFFGGRTPRLVWA